MWLPFISAQLTRALTPCFREKHTMACVPRLRAVSATKDVFFGCILTAATSFCNMYIHSSHMVPSKQRRALATTRHTTDTNDILDRTFVPTYVDDNVCRKNDVA